ncbi:MAG: cytidylate kinase-like family protein [Muribaculaceae bacterium]|nr:cytidylate kinase-like family protein [Muribaculaceae bacterium]
MNHEKTTDMTPDVDLSSRKYVITIGRSYGSGGRALGRALSERLGIPFYDKELLMEAARSSGMSADFFERNDERMPSFFQHLPGLSMSLNPMAWYGGSTAISPDSIYRLQSDFIQSLAQQGPCVIVGRTADYILRDHPDVINIFVHAPVDVCVARVMERGECETKEAARTLVEKTNRLRSNYYNFYTDKRWGHSTGYDLTLDSSRLPMEELTDLVIEYMKRRLR